MTPNRVAKPYLLFIRAAIFVPFCRRCAYLKAMKLWSALLLALASTFAAGVRAFLTPSNVCKGLVRNIVVRAAEQHQDPQKREKEEATYETEFERLQAFYEKQQRTVFKLVGAQQKQLQQLQDEGNLSNQKKAQLLIQQKQQQQQQQQQPVSNSPQSALPISSVPQSLAAATAVAPGAAPEAAPGWPGMHKPGQIFVCTNKWCREKGADATMATFSFLAGATPVVPVNCLGRCNKGPNIRIFTPDSAFIEASMVRSVETVVSLLQEHLNIKVNITQAEVLRLNYEGNVFLREGEVDYAIDRYNRALALGDKEQEGVLLVMRGSALLQRAYACRLRHKDLLLYAEQALPSLETIKSTLEAINCLKLPVSVLGKITCDYLERCSLGQPKVGQPQSSGDSSASTSNEILNSGGRPSTNPGFGEIIRKCNFAYSLYEFALMGALEDLLTATILLPGFAQAWRRAGDALGELQHFNSAVEYYEVASQLDAGLGESLVKVIERLRVMERMVENAESRGWSKEQINTLLEDVA